MQNYNGYNYVLMRDNAAMSLAKYYDSRYVQTCTFKKESCYVQTCTLKKPRAFVNVIVDIRFESSNACMEQKAVARIPLSST